MFRTRIKFVPGIQHSGKHSFIPVDTAQYPRNLEFSCACFYTSPFTFMAQWFNLPQDNFPFSIYYKERLRWSRGSVLAFSIQVRWFKPGRNRRIFKGEKILSTPSFGGEVKPSVPCRRFAAYKRSLNGVEFVISAKLPDKILAHSSHFRR